MAPTSDQLKMLQELARHYPQFGEFVAMWRTEELEQIPNAQKEALDVMRGRVQTLTTLQRFLGLRT